MERVSTPNDLLFDAIHNVDVDKAWSAVESGADLSAVDDDGLTPLHRVVANDGLWGRRRLRAGRDAHYRCGCRPERNNKRRATGPVRRG